MSDFDNFYGIYLNCKTRKGDSDCLYVFEEKDENLNKSIFYFQRNYYIIDCLTEKKIDVKKNQNIIDSKKNEKLLFKLIVKISDKPEVFSAKINLNYLKNFKTINKSKSVPWNTCLWYVVNSEQEKLKYIQNEDYYLEENDIIKIGAVKYIISKLHIENMKDNNKKGKLIDTEPPCIDISKCEHCGDLLIKLCDCEDFYHYKELKEYVKGRKIETNNSKNTVKNYYFNLLYCDEKNDNNICNTFYSLKFKCKVSDLIELGLIDSEKIKEDRDIIEINDEKYKIFSLYDFELSENKDYMILESLEDGFTDSANKNKSVHIVELNGEDINIGRYEKTNDIILKDNGASGQHAIIKYNKEKGKYFIKNLSTHSGTLILIHPKNNILEFKYNKDNPKPFFFQVNKTLFEAGITTLKKFKSSIKNKNSRILLDLSDRKSVV